MLFEKKKIQIETLSEYLTEVRANLQLSTEEVCKKTDLVFKFLSALESGNFKVLPSDVYVYGFLKKLAFVYAIDSETLIDQYKKERGIEQQLSKKSETLAGTRYKNYFQKFVITPKILSLALGLTFIVISVGYIIWQVWSINRIPSLELVSPLNNAVIAASFIEVKGRTDPGMTVAVNDQAIFVDAQGGFQTQLALVPGPKEIVIVAKNRFGKLLSKNRSITGVAVAAADSISQLQLKADFSALVILTFIIDDQPEQVLTFNQGDSKTFFAHRQILLSTTDAGATRVTVNGQVLGAMGRAKEPLNNIPFFAQSGSISQ